ncbi:hypothetical protein [Stenotrophomonas sp. YIM B06876]|uniref:DUF7009 family protein n=1 Tax=Stenotrophomonas sp. YIM B06876 TaxID=3060211 RepID=UPI00273A229D|nr:hypothetical protein [Stenotrophomonas sp. YIM B06876]
MKLQLQGQRVRFRLEEAEFSALRGGQTVSNHTCAGAVDFHQSLRLEEVAQPGLDASAGHWQLTLPRAAVEAYAGQLPCRQGLEFALRQKSGELLQVVFEVDVRDSVRTRGAGRRLPADAP